MRYLIIPVSGTIESQENEIQKQRKELFSCKMADLIHRCSATKGSGFSCTAIIAPDGFRCYRHQQVLNRKSPRDFITDEVVYRKNRMFRFTRDMPIVDIDEYMDLRNSIRHWYGNALFVFRNMTDTQITNLLAQRGRWYIRGHPEPIDEHGVVVPHPAPPAHVQPPPGTELGQFAADKQNVHRKATVDQTVEIVKRVLKIPVPPEYRWNLDTLSKTPGEIIVYCKLTPIAGSTMTLKYSSDDDVYELGRGIYGKVLDSVWQYVSKSDDKESMCAILKQELQDNIGMCAQGNLSRLCNVLAGYMEGVEDIESQAEKLGRLIPPLMDIVDVTERIKQAKRVLEDVGLPTTEWNDWLDPLNE